MADSKLRIQGMTCSHCAVTVERALTQVEGVTNARVIYIKKEAQVHGNADPQELVKAVEEAGYKAIPKEESHA